MRPEKKALLNKLIQLLRTESLSWRWAHGDSNDPGYIIHESGVELWVWSGAARVWRPRIEFGFIGKKRLRAAFRHWRSVHGAQQADAADDENVRAVLRKLMA